MYSSTIMPGTLVFGKYRVLYKLGEGSTSRVYACSHPQRANAVLALKVLNSKMGSNSDLLWRFRDEIHTSYRISHPNVVRGFEFIQGEGFQAYSMECLEGGSLSDILKSGKRTEIPKAIQILEQICLGLQAIHNAGIVHRDIKPSNVLMTPKGDAKISDFNTILSKNLTGRDYDLGTIGTIEYMSPEVLSDGIAEPRSDIYAVGIIAYELITGSLPFNGKTCSEMLKQKKGKRPQAVHRVDPNCPKSLSKFISRAMATRAKNRFQSVSHMLHHLYHLDSGIKKRSIFRLA